MDLATIEGDIIVLSNLFTGYPYVPGNTLRGMFLRYNLRENSYMDGNGLGSAIQTENGYYGISPNTMTFRFGYKRCECGGLLYHNMLSNQHICPLCHSSQEPDWITPVVVFSSDSKDKRVLQTIETGTVLRFYLVCEDIVPSLEFFRDPKWYALGGLRSRGFGQIELQNLTVRTITMEEIHQTAAEILEEERITLEVISPLVIPFNISNSLKQIFDRLQQPAGASRTSKFEVQEEVSGEPSAFFRYSSRTKRRMKYNALKPGSKIRIRVQNFETALALAALCIVGLGRMRKLGYGELIISDKH